jgi:hypothetical protein
MRPIASRSLVPAALALSLLVAACSPDAGPVAPDAGVIPTAGENLLARDNSVSLLACPVSTSRSGEAVIGARGGRLDVAGHALIVPAGAVKKDTRFVLSVPASPVLEVDVSADGKRHYRFKSPVQLRLSYARCASPSTADLIGAWIDGGAGGAKEMPSVHDRAAQRVTITTEHLSGYAIAYRNGRGNEGENEP